MKLLTKFRWTLTSPGHNIEWWCNKLEIDHVNQVLNWILFDDVKGEVDKFLRSLPTEKRKRPDKTLILVSYDAYGSPLCETRFSDLKLLQDKTCYDMGDDKIVMRDTKIMFGEIKRVEIIQ